MRISKQLLIALCGLLLMACMLSIDGAACSCGRRKPLTPCEAYGGAAAVFIGRFLQGSRKVERIKKEGKYEIGRLPPGKYLIGVNLRQPQNGRLFFPAGSEIAQATAIVVRFGEKVSDVNLTILKTEKSRR